MPFACGAAVVATVAALAATLDAHHSISAIYDSRRQVTVTGNVRVTEGTTVNTFANASVQRIRVNAGGGNDRVTVETLES